MLSYTYRSTKTYTFKPKLYEYRQPHPVGRSFDAAPKQQVIGDTSRAHCRSRGKTQLRITARNASKSQREPTRNSRSCVHYPQQGISPIVEQGLLLFSPSRCKNTAYPLVHKHISSNQPTYCSPWTWNS